MKAGPSDDAETGSRALTLPEVEQLREDFIAAAVRSERAGFNGVELHGAHGDILGQFMSSTYNRRDLKVGVAGRLMDAATARRCLEHGADFVTIGRAAILHHDFPERVRANPEFQSMPLPSPHPSPAAREREQKRARRSS